MLLPVVFHFFCLSIFFTICVKVKKSQKQGFSLVSPHQLHRSLLMGTSLTFLTKSPEAKSYRFMTTMVTENEESKKRCLPKSLRQKLVRRVPVLLHGCAHCGFPTAL